MIGILLIGIFFILLMICFLLYDKFKFLILLIRMFFDNRLWFIVFLEMLKSFLGDCKECVEGLIKLKNKINNCLYN